MSLPLVSFQLSHPCNQSLPINLRSLAPSYAKACAWPLIHLWLPLLNSHCYYTSSYPPLLNQHHCFIHMINKFNHFIPLLLYLLTLVPSNKMHHCHCYKYHFTFCQHHFYLLSVIFFLSSFVIPVPLSPFLFSSPPVPWRSPSFPSPFLSHAPSIRTALVL